MRTVREYSAKLLEGRGWLFGAGRETPHHGRWVSRVRAPNYPADIVLRPMPATDRERFQALFEEIRNQVYFLQMNWTLYVRLTGNLQTLELLRVSAKYTFGVINKLLLETIYLGTHRLIDAGVSSSTKRTASMETLIHRLPPASAPLRRRLQKQLKYVRRECENLSDWRHLPRRTSRLRQRLSMNTRRR